MYLDKYIEIMNKVEKRKLEVGLVLKLFFLQKKIVGERHNQLLSDFYENDIPWSYRKAICLTKKEDGRFDYVLNYLWVKEQKEFLGDDFEQIYNAEKSFADKA